MGCCSVYALLFIVGVVVQLVKNRRRNRFFFRAGDANVIPEPLLQERGVNYSDTESRLRESIVIGRDSNLCSICLDAYDQQKAIQLDCGHIYHSQCIRLWIKDHDTCPLCRG